MQPWIKNILNILQIGSTSISVSIPSVTSIRTYTIPMFQNEWYKKKKKMLFWYDHFGCFVITLQVFEKGNLKLYSRSLPFPRTFYSCVQRTLFIVVISINNYTSHPHVQNGGNQYTYLSRSPAIVLIFSGCQNMILHLNNIGIGGTDVASSVYPRPQDYAQFRTLGNFINRFRRGNL